MFVLPPESTTSGVVTTFVWHQDVDCFWIYVLSPNQHHNRRTRYILLPDHTRNKQPQGKQQTNQLCSQPRVLLTLNALSSQLVSDKKNIVVAERRRWGAEAAETHRLRNG